MAKFSALVRFDLSLSNSCGIELKYQVLLNSNTTHQLQRALSLEAQCKLMNINELARDQAS